jgi:hypothetical protein
VEHIAVTFVDLTRAIQGYQGVSGSTIHIPVHTARMEDAWIGIQFDGDSGKDFIHGHCWLGFPDKKGKIARFSGVATDEGWDIDYQEQAKWFPAYQGLFLDHVNQPSNGWDEDPFAL